MLNRFLNFYSHLAKYTLSLKLFVNLLKYIKLKKYFILNLTESPAWHCKTVRCKMFNPNIFYLSVMPAQIYGRHILPKFRFTFMKNVNIHNSLLCPAVCRTHILLRLVCSSGGIALILSLTGVIGIWWWVGQNRTQPLLFGLLILPAWDIIDPAVSDRKWIDCGPLTLHIGCF